jgi:nucleoid DNA-binding protein
MKNKSNVFKSSELRDTLATSEKVIISKVGVFTQVIRPAHIKKMGFGTKKQIHVPKKTTIKFRPFPSFLNIIN